MKFISALAIQQTEVILVQDRLHRSFRKSCPAKGAKRKTTRMNLEKNLDPGKLK